jgi:hypothetical protein
MLRLREWLEFKPEDSVGKFEVLVVSGQDRILGEMVREKRMVERKKEEVEYYKRKKAQKEAAEKEAKAKGEGDRGEKDKSDEMEGEKVKKAKSDTSTKKVKDGEEVGKAAEVVDDKDQKDAKVEKEDEGRLMVAIPIKTDGVKGQDLDEKHDQVAKLAGPGEAAAAAAQAKAGDKKPDKDEDKEGNKEEKGEKKEDEKKEVRDPMRDAERIAKMMGNTGNLKMEDIQIALKVLEAASGMSPLSFDPSPLLFPSSAHTTSMETKKLMK